MERIGRGEFVEQGHHDILTEALGTPEHGGRVRGYAKGVERKDVFGKAPRRPVHAACVPFAAFQQIQQQVAHLQEQMNRMQEFNVARACPPPHATTSASQEDHFSTQVDENPFVPWTIEKITVSIVSSCEF